MDLTSTESSCSIQRYCEVVFKKQVLKDPEAGSHSDLINQYLRSLLFPSLLRYCKM